MHHESMNTPPPSLQALIDAEDLPPQRKFAINKGHWLRWLGHIDPLSAAIEQIPDQVDRTDVARFVTDNLGSNTPGAFVAAMAWGHGSSNYGPYRTAYILTKSRVRGSAGLSSRSVSRLDKATEIAANDGPARGFYYLNNDGKIAGLGPAFFTKWLYFVTTQDGRNVESTAPILDEEVMRWLREHNVPRLRYAKTPSYEKYMELLRHWGSTRSGGDALTAADVEERIFRLIRNDGATPQRQDPTHGSQR